MATTSVRAISTNSPIVVRIPAEVTFDLTKFTKVIANLGERLGCGPCISGANCNFEIIREFVVNPATLKVDVLSEALHG